MPCECRKRRGCEGSGRKRTRDPKPELAHAGVAQIRIDHRVRAVTRLDTLSQDDRDIRTEVVQAGFVQRGGTTTTATVTVEQIRRRVLPQEHGRRSRGLISVDAG